MTSLVVLAANALGGIALARSLGPAGRGEIASLVVWSALASTIATSGTVGALTFFAARPKPEGKSAARSVVRSFPLMALGGLALFATVALAGNASVGVALVAMAISVPLRTLLAQVQGYRRGQQAFRTYNWTRLVARAGAPLLFIALAIGRILTVQTAALAYVIALVGGLIIAWSGRPPDRDEPAHSTAADGQDEVVSFWSYSRRNLVAALGMQGNQQIDLFALSLVAPPEFIGVYAVATGVAAPIAAIGSSAGLVAFPRVTRAATPQRKFAVVRRQATFAALVGGAAASGVILLSGALIPLLFGPEFGSAAPAARILGVGVWAFGLSLVAGSALKGLGRPGIVAASQLAGMATTFTLIVWPNPGNLAAIALASAAGYLVSLTIEIVSLTTLYRAMNQALSPGSEDPTP